MHRCRLFCLVLSLLLASFLPVLFAQDITTKEGVIDALNRSFRGGEVSRSATINGSELVIHSERCSQERFAQVTGNQAALRLWRRAGFSQLVYTNDKELTFSIELPSGEPTDTDRQQYAKNYEAGIAAKHPEFRAKVTVERTRIAIHSPFGSKVDFDRTDWTVPKKIWASYGFTEFLYTNDRELAILLPLTATAVGTQPVPNVAANPDLAKPVSKKSVPATNTQPPDHLSESEVAAAIAAPPNTGYVRIEDMGFSAPSRCNAQMPSESLFTPEGWLNARSRLAKKQYLEFRPTAADTLRVLRVDSKGCAGGVPPSCDTISRVVLLSDRDGTVVVEAIAEGSHDETWQNAYGASASCSGLVSFFALSDVQKVQNDKGEFVIATFSGSHPLKQYTVKEKHIRKLGLNAQR
ncbi:MAG: hypothetical protein ABSD88_08790 [Candidatus Korobacteraceae bacterium]